MPALADTLHPSAAIERYDARYLDDILAIETASHPVPWQRESFLSAEREGYFFRLLMAARRLVIGYVVASPGVGEAHLLNITIAAPSRGLGYAAQLLQSVVRWARNVGAKQLLLEVRPSNLAAQRAYTRFGFAPLARRKAYYPPRTGETLREDALLFALPLTEAQS